MDLHFTLNTVVNYIPVDYMCCIVCNLLSFTAYEITVNEIFAVQYIFYLCLVSVGNTALLALITVYFCGIILICGRNFIDLLFF